MLVIGFCDFTRQEFRPCADKSAQFIDKQIRAFVTIRGRTAFPNMKSADNLKLTKRNAEALAKYAGLVGLTPEEFLNRFLKDFLTDFWDDRNDDGNAEAYLGSFTLKHRATAERLAAWMQDRFEKLGLGPEVKFEIEVIESPRGKFRVVAASFYRGQMCHISGED